MDKADRIDRILKNEFFRLNVEKNGEAEAERCFCRHDMSHFLDVARIGMILNLKEQQGVEEELVYAAGLLHDIGKHLQYNEGTPHEQASAEIAPAILWECGFSEEDGYHRKSHSRPQRQVFCVREGIDRNTLPCRQGKPSMLCL